jgi:hypothetical protein
MSIEVKNELLESIKESNLNEEIKNLLLESLK